MDGNAVNFQVTWVHAIKSGRLIRFGEESPVLHKQSLNSEIEGLRQIQQECTVQVQVKQVILMCARVCLYALACACALE